MKIKNIISSLMMIGVVVTADVYAMQQQQQHQNLALARKERVCARSEKKELIRDLMGTLDQQADMIKGLEAKLVDLSQSPNNGEEIADLQERLKEQERLVEELRAQVLEKSPDRSPENSGAALGLDEDMSAEFGNPGFESPEVQPAASQIQPEGGLILDTSEQACQTEAEEDDSVEQFRGLQEHINQLTVRLTTLSERCKVLEAQSIRTIESSKCSIEAEVARTQQAELRLKEAQQRILSLEDQNTQFARRIDAVNSELQSTQLIAGRVPVLEQERDQLVHRIDAINLDLQSTQLIAEKVPGLEQERAQLAHRIDAINLDLQSVQALAGRVPGLEQERVQLTNEIAKITAQMQEIQNALQQEHAQSIRVRDELTSQLLCARANVESIPVLINQLEQANARIFNIGRLLEVSKESLARMKYSVDAVLVNHSTCSNCALFGSVFLGVGVAAVGHPIFGGALIYSGCSGLAYKYDLVKHSKKAFKKTRKFLAKGCGLRKQSSETTKRKKDKPKRKKITHFGV